VHSLGELLVERLTRRTVQTSPTPLWVEQSRAPILPRGEHIPRASWGLYRCYLRTESFLR
jgi:hypothetical protein